MCFYEGKIVHLCEQCVDYLYTCIPRIGKNGYIHGECDFYYCEFCSDTRCVFNPKLDNQK